MDTGDSSLAQAAYIQQKLETFYYRTYANLYRHKDAVRTLQEVLVWRKASTTVLLYVVIHGAFVYLVQNSTTTALSLVGNGILWCLLIDAIMRAALRDRRDLNIRTTKKESLPRPVDFDKVMVEINKPREPQQFLPFEIVCLQIAQVWVWLDNLWLAMCYWFLNEPLTFAVLLAIPGFVLSVVGRLVPTIVIMYIAVMAVVVYPFMGFYEQQLKIMKFIEARFPHFQDKTGRVLTFIRNLRSSSSADNADLSLDIGGDSRTQEALSAEFQQAMVPKGTEQPVLPTAPPLTPTAPPPTPAVSSAPELEDSYVGTPFSSVSNLDSSLNLPSFTPQMMEHYRRNQLDPFTDSLDLSLGTDFTDGGHRPHGLARIDENESARYPPPPRYTAQPAEPFVARPPPPPYSAQADVHSRAPRNSGPHNANRGPHRRFVSK